MKIFCKNTAQGFVPVYDSDWELKKKLKQDEVYSLDAKYERNYQFHKKFMALCKIGCENSKHVEMPFDAYRKYATIKAGYCDIYSTPKGKYVEAKSLAFDRMSQEEFEDVYNRVLQFIMADIQADAETINRELVGFL